MKSSEGYLDRALALLELARRTTDPEIKASLLDLAAGYLDLADLAEKNSRTDIVYETPPRPGWGPR